MTSGLVMNIKASPQKHSEYHSRLEKRKLRAHLGAQRNAQLRSMGLLFVGDFLTGLPQAIEMAADSVARHFERLFFGAPIRDHTWKQRNCHLVTRLHGLFSAGPLLWSAR